MTGQNVGYIRVSTTGQNTDRQLEGVTLDRIFTEKISGKNRVRPQFTECQAYLRQGDTLHVFHRSPGKEPYGSAADH